MNSEATVEAPPHPVLFRVLVAIALAYSLLAGLRTITDYDLPWQLATGRWICEHGAIPDTDVFSYTASGQPWIYPIASCLLLYAIFMDRPAVMPSMLSICARKLGCASALDRSCITGWLDVAVSANCGIKFSGSPALTTRAGRYP